MRLDFKSAFALRLNGFEPRGDYQAMPYVPRWVGYVGFLLVVIFAFSAFTNSVLFMFLSLVACFVIVIVENRYERGLMGRN